MSGFLALAFAAGLLSCASTCVLPLVPAYITYMGGRAAAGANEAALRQQARVLGNALLFVAGFTTVFVLFGATAGLIGADLKAYRAVLVKVAGVALVAMGVALLAGMPWLMRERRLDVAHRLPRAPWASYVVGLAFAAGWTPCVSPVLTAILITAADQATAGQGALLLTAYSLGLGVPFLIAAGLLGPFTRLLARVRGALSAVNGVAAALMVGMGVLVFTNQLTVLNNYFPYLAPPFADLGSQRLSDRGVSSSAVPLKPGTPAPAFTLTDVDGRRVSLADLKGRPVLVSFWATWCSPCREELPLMKAAYLDHRDQGFTLIAVDFGQESTEAIRKFWNELDLQPAPYPDPDARVSTAYGVGLKTTGLPVSVFIARDGTVNVYEPGAVNAELLQARLKEIL